MENEDGFMSEINSALKLNFSPILSRTLSMSGYALPDRGMGLTSVLVKASWEAEKEEITQASEERARQILGSKVDQLV